MELVRVLPGMLLGPPLRKQESNSIKFVKSLLYGELDPFQDVCQPVVDVRDAAEVHVAALLKEDGVDGKRYICVGEVLFVREIADTLRRLYPDYPVSRKGIVAGPPERPALDTGSVKGDFKFKKFRGVSTALKEMVSQLTDLGILTPAKQIGSQLATQAATGATALP